METKVVDEQKAVCRRYSADFVASPAECMTGLAKSTKGLMPINGLRNAVENGTSGWYIWFGEEFSEASDFFVPLHTRHLYEDYPTIARLLGLPPGYRFLLAGEYLDVWYDESLLKT